MKIAIKGVIVSNDYKWLYEWFEIDAVSPRDVSDQLDKAKANEDLEVHINSPGGHVDAGSEIYTALKSHKGKVTVQIVGMAASAASVIAMAGSRVEISPTAQIMIHNVSGGVWGDYRAMQHESEVLKNYNKSIANAYRLKTGLEESELLSMMNKETWLNAQQAKEKGFVDAVMFDDEQAPKLVAGYGMIPEAVVSKMREFLAQQKPAPSPEPVIDSTLQAKLAARKRQLALKFREV